MEALRILSTIATPSSIKPNFPKPIFNPLTSSAKPRSPLLGLTHFRKSKFTSFTAITPSVSTDDEPETETLDDKDDQFDWFDHWYPLMPVCDLDKRVPFGMKVLDLDVVVWWDKKEDAWKVFDDKCPHRLAPLSEGRIEQWGRLQCVYHGWCFGGSGDCKFIPQAPLDGPPVHSFPKACVRVYPSTMQNGIVWFWPNTDPRYNDILSKKKPPYIPELDDIYNRDIPYGRAAIRFENLYTVGLKSDMTPLTRKARHACINLIGVSLLAGFGGGSFVVSQAALKAAEEKVAKHEEACGDNQRMFVPFAFDTFGFLAHEALAFLKRVQKIACGYSPTPDIHDYIFYRIGFAIQKGIATQLVIRLPNVAMYEILVENLMDPSHVPYAHNGIFSVAQGPSAKHDREGGAPIDIINITRIDKNGFTSAELPNRKWSFVPPCLVLSTTMIKENPDDTKEKLEQKPHRKGLFVFFAIPVSASKSRLISASPRNYSLWMDPFAQRWMHHMVVNLIIDSDLYFLRIEEEKLREVDPLNWQKACYMPTKSDGIVVAFRRWLKIYAGGQIDWGTRFNGYLPATPHKEELMDRYRSHVVKCSSCNRVYKNFKALQISLQVFSFALVTIIAATKLLVVTRKILSIVAILCFVGSKWLSGYIYKNFHFHDYNHAFK